jgi:pilus assembly protein Flp/PilA
LNDAKKIGAFQMLKKLLKDESGATAIEYVLIAAAMAAVLIAVMPGLATALTAQFTTITSAVNTGL